jgi:hypothetical protein
MNEGSASVLPWIIFLVVVVAVIFALSRDRRRMKSRTDVEFERDVAASRGSMLAASARGLQAVIGGAEARAAIEHKQDAEAGVTKTGSKGDDADRTAPDSVGDNHAQDQEG